MERIPTIPVSAGDDNKENVGRKRHYIDSIKSDASLKSITRDSDVCSSITSVSSTRIQSIRSAKRLASAYLFRVIDFTIEDPLRSHIHLCAYDRASIVNWMTETCEAFTLTSETFHLSVNYFDRCLAKMKTIDKKQAQIMATACLYIASKLEEVYPPSLDEFADITDHICKAYHIANHELEILLTLEWKMRLTPVSSCLNFLCQNYDMTRENRHMSENDFGKQPAEVRMPSRNIVRRVSSMTPAVRSFIAITQSTYDPNLFLDAMKILNLAILDRNWSRYSSMTLAASALRFATGQQLSYVPNINFNDFTKCVHWMQPFYEVVKSIPIKCLKLGTDTKHKLSATHRIQRCEASVTLLKEAHSLQPQTLPRQLFANISNRAHGFSGNRQSAVKRRKLLN